MTAATIPAALERSASAGWVTRLEGIPTGRREPVGRPARREGSVRHLPGDRLGRQPGSRTGEEKAAVRETRLAPEEPNSQAGVERAALVAEQAAVAALAARCLTGDAQAWEQLARTQHRKVYGICYRFTGSAADAEDLTQEVFLKMYRNLASFDPARGSFGTWLTTLTRNLLVDNYRRSRMERASDSLDEPFGDDDAGGGATKLDRLADTRPGQDQHVAGLELKVQIQRALAEVSPELREAVILRDLQDMDYKDIAEVLGVPQGTVKSRISRGRSELARLLKGMEGKVM
jgi:RNA polymerase sigma-70 factor (ECF subfamily)